MKFLNEKCYFFVFALNFHVFICMFNEMNTFISMIGFGDRHHTDELLYSLIQKGDKTAFDMLFLKYYPALCAYGKQFVEMEDAEEIVQDVMLWLWENKESTIVETSMQHYLFRSVKNKCITLINKNILKQKVNHILQSEMQEIFGDPDFYIVEELTQNIDKAIRKLPESYRIAFEMNRFQNKTYQEIANELEISPKTVDYRIQQALKILRRELKDYLPLIILGSLDKW